MFKLTRLADYGIMLMGRFARAAAPTRSARDLAAESHLPLPTVSKILKALAKAGLLDAHRGVKGGFSLSRTPERIAIADIIEAIEGPISFTQCCEGAGHCNVESHCGLGVNWRKINNAVGRALRGVTLAEMVLPARGVEFRITV